MNYIELFVYIFTVIAMIAIPGPVMILVASSGLKGGYRVALQTIFGTNLASLILIALSILMLKGFLVVDERIFTLIKLLGSLYIGYLGFTLFKDSFTTHAEMTQTLKPVSGGFKKGFLVGISNPKDIIFFSAFFPQFIGIHPQVNVSLGILIFFWIVLDFLTLSVVYKAFYTLSKSQFYTKVLATCAVLLILIAAYSFYRSVQFFLT